MNKDEVLAEFIPKHLRDNFHIEVFKEGLTSWKLKLTENVDKVPKELQGTVAVLNGYMDPIEILDFPFKGKLVHLTFHRRRWKEQGEPKNYYHNNYTFHREGMKTTDEFGDFLKGIDREEADELCKCFPALRDIIKEIV